MIGTERHLLLIGPDWEITTRFRTDFVKHAVQAGWRVSACAGGPLIEGKQVFEPLGVECYSIPFQRAGMNPISDFRAYTAAVSLMRRIKPDVALAFTIKPATWGLLAAKSARIPVRAALVSGLGFAFIEGKELRRRVARMVAITLYKRSIAKCHRVFFQNPDDENTFRDLKILPDNVAVTKVAGSGVDLQRFPYTPMPSGDLKFVMVARLLREKGVFEFVEAARAVKKETPATRFLLVGPPDQNPTSANATQIESWNREGIVEAVGLQKDVASFLQNAHVFVLPSYREGTPRSALEALAIGRPLLVTDVPGCREVVIDGITGLKVEARNAAALTDGMKWFIEHTSQLQAMSASARAECEKRFDVHAVNSSILSALDADLKNSR